MTMTILLHIESATGMVVNTTLAPLGGEPPAGIEIVPAPEGVGIGYRRAEDGSFEAPASPPPPEPGPNWRGFLQALRTTTVFAALRGQARADVAANALATELRTALGEAALGLVDGDTVQGLLAELLPTLTLAQQAEVAAAIEEFHIPLNLG